MASEPPSHDTRAGPPENEPGSRKKPGRFRWTICALLFVATTINYMDRHGYDACTPRRSDPSVKSEPLIDFSSGYIQRAIGQFPRQGSKKPWRLYQNYVRDLVSLRFGAVNDPALEFARPGRGPAKAA